MLYDVIMKSKFGPAMTKLNLGQPAVKGGSLVTSSLVATFRENTWESSSMSPQFNPPHEDVYIQMYVHIYIYTLDIYIYIMRLLY